MTPTMTDPTERRLRAARPHDADVPVDAALSPDAVALLREARSRAASRPAVRPAARRRGLRFLAPRLGAAAVLAAAAAAVIGWPASHTGPEKALARPLELAVRWFAPAPGTVVHMRSTLASRASDGSVSEIRMETWQAADDPKQSRSVSDQDGARGEGAADGLYDAANDTVYLDVPPGPRQRERLRRNLELKFRALRAQGAGDAEIARLRSEIRKQLASQADEDTGPAIAGDTTVAEIRTLLERGRARVVGRESHDGVEAYVIELHASGKRRTLWTAVSDGRPLELRIDDGPGTAALQTTTWRVYELLSGGSADALVTERGAHPDARIVRDPDAFEAAQARMYPHG